MVLCRSLDELHTSSQTMMISGSNCGEWCGGVRLSVVVAVVVLVVGLVSSSTLFYSMSKYHDQSRFDHYVFGHVRVVAV